MVTIIAGVEDSPRSRDAVAFARQLADATGAQIILAAAYPHARIPSRAISADFDARLHADAERTLEALREEAGDGVVQTRAIRDPSPARALHQLAAGENAALVVVGSSERGEAKRVLAGTTADRLLHGSPCAVAVVPDGYRLEAGPVRRVLVAYDGSHDAREALTAAIALAGPLAAGLSVLQVVPQMKPSAFGLAGGATCVIPPAELARDMRSRLDDLLAEIEGGDRVQAEVVVGDPVKRLTARSGSADLLVMGSRGYGPHRAVMLGGVSGRLVRRASCPVLVLPRGGSAHLDQWLAGEAVTGA